LPHPDIERFLAAAEAAADVAGAVIRPLFRAGLGAELKGDQSPVTLADRTAELVMRAVIAERLPEHGIMGEEFGLERPDAPLRWVLDPIDGTRAFITGRPVFGTLLALLDGDTANAGSAPPAAIRFSAVRMAGGWAVARARPLTKRNCHAPARKCSAMIGPPGRG
jgi:fructose-1,6-bisphosphatase/inositol monophosphatase family enzyme